MTFSWILAAMECLFKHKQGDGVHDECGIT